MESVILRAAVREAIVAHARDEAPIECCGLLIGRPNTIDESVRARNLLRSQTRYLLDPAAHVAANRRLRGTDRSVIGAYHSHPRSPAVPSPTDREESLYPDFVWVIVSLLSADGEVAAYRLTDAGVAPLAIILES